MIYDIKLIKYIWKNEFSYLFIYLRDSLYQKSYLVLVILRMPKTTNLFKYVSMDRSRIRRKRQNKLFFDNH